jgi:hypothetical protein
MEIGGDEVEKIINNLVTEEISMNIDFAFSYHDAMLPSEATFSDHLNDLASDSPAPLPSNVVVTQLPRDPQLILDGAWKTILSKSTKKKLKNHNDRCYMEH